MAVAAHACINCASAVCWHFCIHVWALTGTLAYYLQGFPHWWHHGNTPMMPLGVGILSPTVISFGTDSNTSLFIGFSPYSETVFSFPIHASVLLLVGQVKFNHFRTIAIIPLENL